MAETEKKIPERLLTFANAEDAMNKIVEKGYALPEDMELVPCATSLPKQIAVTVRGKDIIAIREIPMPQFDMSLFAPKPDETEEDTRARVNMAQKLAQYINRVMDKEAIRLAKADCLPANFEAFLDAVCATRGATAEITTESTKKIITEWLRLQNKVTKEHGKPVFFESAAKLIDAIKSNVAAYQFFPKSDPARVDELVMRFYNALHAYFDNVQKSTQVLDKWYNNRKAVVAPKEISLDDLDTLF